MLRLRTITIAVFLLLNLSAQSARAEEYVSTTLAEGESVSLKALQLTRRADNWVKAKAQNPITRRVYDQSEYQHLPVGTEVSFPKGLVNTKPYTATNESVSDICSRFEGRDCSSTILRINTLKSKPGRPFSGVIYIPQSFKPKENSKPAVKIAGQSYPPERHLVRNAPIPPHHQEQMNLVVAIAEPLYLLCIFVAFVSSGCMIQARVTARNSAGA